MIAHAQNMIAESAERIGRPRASFEFFPPKSDALEDKLWESIRKLEPWRHGAGERQDPERAGKVSFVISAGEAQHGIDEAADAGHDECAVGGRERFERIAQVGAGLESYR
jgi:hypothetical protein